MRKQIIASTATIALIPGLIMAPAVSANPEPGNSKIEQRAKKKKVKKATLRVTGKRATNQRIKITVRSNAKYVTFQVNGVAKKWKKRTAKKSRAKTFTLPASFNKGRKVTVRTVKTRKLRATKRTITVAKYQVKKDPAVTKKPTTKPESPSNGDETKDWLKTPEGKAWIDAWSGVDSTGTPYPPGVADAFGDPAKEEAWDAQYVANYEAKNQKPLTNTQLTLSKNGSNLQIAGINNLPDRYFVWANSTALICVEKRTNSSSPWIDDDCYNYPKNPGTVVFARPNGYQYRVQAVLGQWEWIATPFSNPLVYLPEMTPWSNIITK